MEKKYYAVGSVPKSNRKNRRNIGKIDIINTQYMTSYIPGLVHTGTSIKSGGVKLFLWARAVFFIRALLFRSTTFSLQIEWPYKMGTSIFHYWDDLAQAVQFKLIIL